MECFDRGNPEHMELVLRAVQAADAFGLGRLSNVRNQLELNDVRASDSDILSVLSEMLE